MDGMTLEEFEKQVLSTCLRSPIIASVAVSGSGITWLRLRVYLVNGSFIEAYCNESVGRVAFALVQEGRRILGADNTAAGTGIRMKARIAIPPLRLKLHSRLFFNL
jgi:hypothetical protein